MFKKKYSTQENRTRALLALSTENKSKSRVSPKSIKTMV